MANISATTTLDSIVKDIQELSEESFGNRGYYRMLSLASRALLDINKFYATRVVTRKQYNLSDLTNGVLPYPDDCIAVVGVFYNEGNTLFPVTHRKDIIYGVNSPYYNLDDATDYTKEISDNYSANYAQPGAVNKYYVYDDVDGRRLIFDKTDDEKVWLKYISTGIDSELGQDTIVPEIYRETIENYVMWKDLMFRGQVNAALAYKEEYKMAAKKLKAIQLPSLEEFKDAVYSTISQGPRR